MPRARTALSARRARSRTLGRASARRIRAAAPLGSGWRFSKRAGGCGAGVSGVRGSRGREAKVKIEDSPSDFVCRPRDAWCSPQALS
jgi:hypothetical protein